MAVYASHLISGSPPWIERAGAGSEREQLPDGFNLALPRGANQRQMSARGFWSIYVRSNLDQTPERLYLSTTSGPEQRQLQFPTESLRSITPDLLEKPEDFLRIPSSSSIW